MKDNIQISFLGDNMAVLKTVFISLLLLTTLACDKNPDKKPEIKPDQEKTLEPISSLPEPAYENILKNAATPIDLIVVPFESTATQTNITDTDLSLLSRTVVYKITHRTHASVANIDIVSKLLKQKGSDQANIYNLADQLGTLKRHSLSIGKGYCIGRME